MADDPEAALASVLPPALRELLRGRALILQRPVWGARAGRHQAARAGLGHLFRGHRAYAPGDDLRRLDWRAMARRDRPMLRETEGEDALPVALLVDHSGGMAYGEGEARKHQVSAALLAALALLTIRQGDRLGFALGGDGVVDASQLRPLGGAARLRALAAALVAAPLRGTCPWSALVARAAQQLPRRSLVIAASDLLDPCPAEDSRAAEAAERELWRDLAGLRGRGHDLVLLRVLHPDELDPPWAHARGARGHSPAAGALLRVVDPQGVAAPVEGLGAALAAGYHERFAAHRQALAGHCEAHGIHLVEVRCGQPLPAAFLRLLGRLAGLGAEFSSEFSTEFSAQPRSGGSRR